MSASKLFVKSGDTVMVMSGEDKGKSGKVQKAFPSTGEIVVEGVAMVKKHQKPRRQGETGGIIEMETPIYACKVMRVCPKCGKATRPAHKLLDNGTKVRICKKCGETI